MMEEAETEPVLPPKEVLLLVQDRNAGQSITKVALSTQQDLIAYATAKGEVNVYNNDWMKVANYKPVNFLSGDTVACMTWRPDGRALAIAYSSGKIVIKNVETHETTVELNVDDKIEWIDWSPPFWTPEEMTAMQDKRQFEDHIERYVQDVFVPKTASQTSEASKDRERINPTLQMKSQKTLSILSIVTSSYNLHMYAYGFLPVAFVDLQEYLPCKIAHMCAFHLNKNFEAAVIVIRDETGMYQELVYDTSIINRHFEEIEILAKHSDYLWSYRRAIENYFKRLSSVKDENRQELEEKVRSLLKEFERECSRSQEIRPDLATQESAAHFLLAALMEQLVLGTLHPALEHFFEHIATTQDLLKYEAALDQSLKTFRVDVMLPLRKALECCMVSLVMLGRWIANGERFGAVGAVESHFDQVLQNCASFMLKMFELQYMMETESKRCFTAIQWLIMQSEYINHESVSTVRRLSEEDLDDVVSVLQDLFGPLVMPSTNDIEISEPPEWRMKFFGVDAYFLDSDLPEPLNLSRSDFQPYYKEWLTADCEDMRGPFLQAHAQIAYRPPPKALYIHRPEKSAKQELMAFISSLELAFFNIATVVSREIVMIRKYDVYKADGPDDRINFAYIYPVACDKANNETTPANIPYKSAAQIIYATAQHPAKIVIRQHYLHNTDEEQDLELSLTVDAGTVHSSNNQPNEASPGINLLGFIRTRAADVLLLSGLTDGEICMLPCEKQAFIASKEERILMFPEISSAMKSISLTSKMDFFCTNALGTVVALVSNDTRIRIFRISGVPDVELMDDTDVIAQEMRPDLNAVPTV
ncbi:anaphase-promoting complex subunit 4-like [Paramacrobiotus metropolitanus]|uniref:anaphase-promoting complex subunit 4-like n=1 Tax=Paramacrobiotus metropolitanus TaxID=2943436 RepID=UPI002445BAAC|nr:anaphase-promoting complex subunit 4-like [Paramacrobiotus metropolitanus]